VLQQFARLRKNYANESRARRTQFPIKAMTAFFFFFLSSRIEQINRTPSSKSSNFSSSSSSMATLEKKSPASSNKLPHQQSLPTPQTTHHQLQQQLSQPMVQNKNNNINNGGESMQVSNEQQSDNSSLYSVELEPLNDSEHRYIDSDPGFGSMSSSEQAQVTNSQLMRQNQISAEQQEVHQKEVDELKQEVTKLKCDKLDLLRQNVVSPRAIIESKALKLIYSPLPSHQTCQRDIKRLRERELSLQGDLSAASKEIMRLRELLQEFTAAAASNGTIVTNTTTML
jgi:RAP1 GTPase activating protein 1